MSIEASVIENGCSDSIGKVLPGKEMNQSAFLGRFAQIRQFNSCYELSRKCTRTEMSMSALEEFCEVDKVCTTITAIRIALTSSARRVKVRQSRPWMTQKVPIRVLRNRGNV